LRIRLEQFEIQLEGESLRANFDLKSLFVDGPMENGALQPHQYDAGKRAEVEKAMHKDVLRTEEHPRAAFRGTAKAAGAGFQVNGELELAGKTAPLSFDVQNDAGTFRAAFEIEPSRWAIARYKALLGAIRLQDRVRIELALTEAT
jgi:polyisoprenoid-binding protein YceI